MGGVTGASGVKKYTLKKADTALRVIQPGKFRIDYRGELNASQYEAVSSVNGPHLIIAGAGTGKTRTIVYRVAYLVELGVKPEHILLLTFTRKAAQEMLRRAAILLDDRCEKVGGGTFHSFANLTLRKYAAILGYESNFTILDQGDSQDVLNLIRTRLKHDTAKRRFPRKETLHDLYSRSVNTMTAPAAILERDYPHYAELVEEIRNLIALYGEYKRANNLMDYDDLLVNFARLLVEREDVRGALSARYRYIMVDEYQDTNRLQAEIVGHIASSHRNVMVVGDDAQSIYSFRGATVKNILGFPEAFPDCRVIKLEENYRSTQAILNVANALMGRHHTEPGDPQ
jgi:DNA helicase-2/ATP-dependent DNA helicase PcrA